MRKCLFSFGIAVLAVLVLSLGLPLQGQTATTGALIGTVSDLTGALLSGAAVTATNEATDARRATTTDSRGVYRFSLLDPGRYEIEVRKGEFAPQNSYRALCPQCRRAQ
jgi:hypothetical protein